MDNTVTQQEEQRAALISGLRDLANFLDAHPDVPVPTAPSFNVPRRNVADLDAVAEVLGKSVEENWANEMDRLHSLRVTQTFGPIAAAWYVMDPGAMAEYDAQRALVRAAAWIIVCDAGHLPTSTTYTTEAAALAVQKMHETACTGGHTRHLVNPAPTAELVQA